jgi:hypothetical protein
MDAAHSCDVKACVNPRHLRWTDHQENMGDIIAHTGKSSATPLTPDQVNLIRELAGTATLKALSERFGISVTSVWNIIKRKSWAHL